MDTKSNNDFDELEAMFGQTDSDLNRMEKVVLTQNLEGFASWMIITHLNIRKMWES